MATASSRDLTSLDSAHPLTRSEPAYQAFRVLHVAFTVAPIIAGIDKFLEWLVDWDVYLSPLAHDILGRFSHEFMLAVGVIEVVAGLGVAFRPRIFAYIVAAWLGAIVVNLLLAGTYFDIALRDFGLALGALALGRLAAAFRHAPGPARRAGA